MKVGILTDYPSIAVQSGPAIHTQFLHNGLKARGHDVTLIGPDTTSTTRIGDAKSFLFKGIPYASHPKVRVVVPEPFSQLAAAPRLDLIHGQANNHIIEYANWMRRMYRTAVLNTNIIHLPTHSHFILSDGLYGNSLIREATRQWAQNVEKEFARLYNGGDALIVQSRYMVDYWRERGVEVPIEVVGRPIDPAKFSVQPARDPFPSSFRVGHRMVCVCRHDREKNLEQLIEFFDQNIAPADADATLTLIGHGAAHEHYVTLASHARYADRIHFAGEIAHGRLVDWYAHSDLFVYTSLSETFGNVVNEALWTGVPVVALNDRMGVAHQVLDGVNGFLIEPNLSDTAERFARAVLDVLGNRRLKRELGENAATIARRVSHPDVVLSRFEAIYERARQRAHDEIREPLCEKSLVTQRLALARHVASWARYNYLVVALGMASNTFGVGRDRYDAPEVDHHVAQRNIAVTSNPVAAE
jgi:glycosyltransferase involved in cell wall biosynthesis